MSEIKVDTLTGKTTATTVTGPDLFKTDELQGKTSAGDITVTSEGGAATMQLQQGLVKAWAETNNAGTLINDSFNIASLVDTNIGQQTCNYTNDFATGSYPVVTTGQSVGSNNAFSGSSTGNWIVYSFNGSAYSDMGMATIASGDLA
jgi:hypothetical protein